MSLTGPDPVHKVPEDTLQCFHLTGNCRVPEARVTRSAVMTADAVTTLTEEDAQNGLRRWRERWVSVCVEGGGTFTSCMTLASQVP